MAKHTRGSVDYTTSSKGPWQRHASPPGGIAHKPPPTLLVSQLYVMREARGCPTSRAMVYRVPQPKLWHGACDWTRGAAHLPCARAIGVRRAGQH
jgi:hypothetical protein